METPDGTEKVKLVASQTGPGGVFMIRGKRTEISLLAGDNLAGMKALYTGGGQVLALANKAGGSVSPTNSKR
jgi:hypothetical protein